MLVIEAVLVADFDIDVGSSLSAQYPIQYVESNLKVSSIAEMMLPDGAHLREEDWTVFFLKPKSNNQLLHVINLVRTKKTQANRGARVKGMAIVSRHPYVHVFKPMLVLALERYFSSQSDSLLQQIYDTVNQAGFESIPQLSLVEKCILRGGCAAVLGEPDSCAEVSALIAQPKKFTKILNETSKITYDGVQYQWETKMRFDGINVPVKVPIDLFQDEVGDYSTSQFVNTFHGNQKAGEPSGVMLILHSILSQRRVLFLGAMMPACDVAKYVLAAISLCSPILRGFSERAFPYICLSNIDSMLSQDGYVAGVTNPAFQTHDDWYDILCDITTGKVSISPRLNAQTPYGYTQTDQMVPVVSAVSLAGLDSPSATQKSGDNEHKEKELIQQDNEFMTEVHQLVQARAMDSEVRLRFRQYVRRFVQIASLYEFHFQRLGAAGFNQMLKKPGLLAKNSTGKLLDDFHELPIPKGSYQVTQGVNFPPLIGPRAVFNTAEQQRKQLQMFSKRIVSWKNSDSYNNYAKDWMAKLDNRILTYKGSKFDQNQVIGDEFLASLFNYEMLTKEGDQFVMQLGDGQAVQSVQVANGLFFDDSDVERLLANLTQRQGLSAQQVYKLLSQLCISVKNESQMIQLFSLLPLNEGGLGIIAEAMFHKDFQVRSKCLELLHIIWKNEVGKTYVSKMNTFALQALTSLEKEAALKEMLATRRLHTHDQVTLQHLTPIVSSLDSVKYNPSYMSFSENSLQKTADSEESLVFDEGMDFISQYSLQEGGDDRQSSKEVTTLLKIDSSNDIEKSEAM